MLNTECNLHSVFFYATLARPDHATFTSLTQEPMTVAPSSLDDKHLWLSRGMLTRMNLSQSKLAQMVPFKAQDDDLIVSATRSFRAAIHTHWVTAKVIENRRAKRFINRLDVLGFEYLIQHDNHDLRILVRSDQLEEALGWFEELARPRFTSKRKHWRTIIGLVAAGASDWHVGWLNFLKPYWLGWFIVDSNFCDLRSDGGYCSGFAARLVDLATKGGTVATCFSRGIVRIVQIHSQKSR